MDEIKVTVICLTYNHVSYIRDALEGFVSQKTGFPFEVIVHDDASTDGTADIVREYQARYPLLIRAVLQKENQYSRGVKIARTFIYPLVRGEYVALCEGDDYWTDPLKLQRQVEALEAHPEADICSHKAERRVDGKFKGWVAPRWRSGIITVEKVILGGGANLCATSSVMCRSKVYLENTPMRDIITIDYVLAIQGSLRGGMVYLDDPMSVYRFNVEGSWTRRHKGVNIIANKETLMRMLACLDEYTSGRCHKAIALRMEMFRSDIFLKQRDYRRLYSVKRLGINLHRLRSALGRALRSRALF